MRALRESIEYAGLAACVGSLAHLPFRFLRPLASVAGSICPCTVVA